jgi:hypothetical protein
VTVAKRAPKEQRDAIDGIIEHGHGRPSLEQEVRSPQVLQVDDVKVATLDKLGVSLPEILRATVRGLERLATQGGSEAAPNGLVAAERNPDHLLTVAAHILQITGLCVRDAREQAYSVPSAEVLDEVVWPDANRGRDVRSHE